jgi:hypothetical protein
MNSKLVRLGKAFRDGLYTGWDPIGTIWGYIKKEPTTGYLADKYSLPKETFLELWGSGSKEFSPVNRSLDEVVIKSVGDVTGLASQCLVGIPQMLNLATNLLIRYQLGRDIKKIRRVLFWSSSSG